MKKWFLILLAFFLVSIMPASVFASSVKVFVNGEFVEFDQQPVIKEGRLLVSLRSIFAALGAVVTWDEENKTACAVFRNIRVNIPVGSFLPTVNGLPVQIDVPAMYMEQRIFIPLRFAVESLRGSLSWDASTASIFITISDPASNVKENSLACQVNFQDKIDINRASLESLLRLEGISEKTALQLLEYRDANGGFKTFEQIKSIPMTDAQYKHLRENIQIIYREEGMACWYGTKFHGRMTSSGEVYDQNLHTAAHRTLPFGTMVKVTFPLTGRSIWARINDRGPHVAGRIIDLSLAAADAIGLIPYGLGHVELEVVKE